MTVEMTQAPDRAATRLGRNYWRLWWANTISSTGDGAFVAALPLLAVTISRDPRLVAVVTAAIYLPWMLLSLPAGALVDRYDRATLMWRAQAVQAAVVAAVAVLVVFRTANIAVLGLAGLLLGSAEVVFSNAAQAVLPALVPPELLARANGNQQVSHGRILPGGHGVSTGEITSPVRCLSCWRWLGCSSRSSRGGGRDCGPSCWCRGWWPRARWHLSSPAASRSATSR